MPLQTSVCVLWRLRFRTAFRKGMNQTSSFDPSSSEAKPAPVQIIQPRGSKWCLLGTRIGGQIGRGYEGKGRLEGMHV